MPHLLWLLSRVVLLLLWLEWLLLSLELRLTSAIARRLLRLNRLLA